MSKDQPLTSLSNEPSRTPARWKIAAAFAAVYILWGSTYLAIRFAIETLPPFLMAGVRFMIAGSILYLWARLRGTPRPLAVHWRSAAVIGALLLLGGNGGVVWAQQFVPSSIAALIVATVPLWMVLIQSFWTRETFPSPTAWAGILLGLAGIWFLAAPDHAEVHGIPPLAAGVLLMASLSWALGSLLTRRLTLPDSSPMSIGMEMLSGGVCLLSASLLAGEWGRFDPSAVSFTSLMGLVYLIVFGALVGFSCYIWIVKVTPPALSSTYAYVNPVVAVCLGWAFAGEELSARTLTGAAIIITAVFIITLANLRAAHNSPAAKF